jgi:hypothetical protein
MIIQEYKNKIKSMMSFNDNSVYKIKELETISSQVDEIAKNLRLENENLNINLQVYKEKYEIEQNLKIRIKNEKEDLQNQTNTLISLLKNLFENEKTRKFNEENYFSRIRLFYLEKSN